MKISKKFKIIFVLLFTIILTFSTIVAYADNDVETTSLDETTTSVEAESTENKVQMQDLYVQDKSVTIDYPVKGNVFILAEDVTIDSNITGNVFVLAKNVNIASRTYVNSCVFLCADSATVSGVVFDLYSLTNSLSISSGARILRDITAYGASLDLSGSIQRNARLNFNNINANADTASILGNLSYTNSSNSIPAEIVSGEYSFDESATKSNSLGDYLQNLLSVIIISIIIICIIVFVTPKFANKSQQILKNKLPTSIGYGAIALIGIPVICFILFCTVLGIMPAVSILFAYLFIILEVASSLVAIPLAKCICGKLNKNTKGINILVSIILVILIWLLEQIPVFGNIVLLLVAILGLGILAYSIFHPKIEKKDKK